MNNYHIGKIAKLCGIVSLVWWNSLGSVSVTGSQTERTFYRVHGLVNLRFGDARAIPNIRYKLQCPGACDQLPWCNAITWDENTKTCNGFTRNLRQEVTPADVSHVYMSNRDVCLGKGYTNTTGMCIKFFTDVTPLPWQEAEDFCVSEGGRLVVADTMDKLQYIGNQHVNDPILQGITSWWTGGYKVDDNWFWTTGQPVSSHLPMTVNEPETAFCLEFHSRKFDDVHCAFNRHPICEK